MNKLLNAVSGPDTEILTYSVIMSSKNIIYAALESGRAIDIYIDNSGDYY